MKKTITKYLILSTATLFALFGFWNKSLAWNYVQYDVSYVVSATPVPVVTITANPTSGTVNSVHGILSWSATNNPTSCSASGDWSGAQAVSGNNVDQGVLTQVRTYTYTLTCSNASGTSSPASATVVVNSATNNPPTCNAGANQSITLPTNSVSLSGSGSDPDGDPITYQWSKTAGPSSYNISSPTSASTSVTGLVQGTYTFQFVTTDNHGASCSPVSTTQVTVNPAASPSGSLTVSPNTCTISSGASTCSVTGATWTTSNTTSPQLQDGNTGNILSTLANNATPLQVWVAYPSTTFNLKDGGTLLDSKVATASCTGGTSWNGTICATVVVNGVCAATHWNCTAGTSINNATGANSWTWQCKGSGGGSTASCSENFPVGSPQCSDGIDNNGDGLIDSNQPSCHTDCNANNASSYNPNLNNEAKRCINPIYKEL